MVELTYGGLQGLRPRSLRDHYIEAYYGSECVFTGFMQCQEFDDDWVAAPPRAGIPHHIALGFVGIVYVYPTANAGAGDAGRTDA